MRGSLLRTVADAAAVAANAARVAIEAASGTAAAAHPHAQQQPRAPRPWPTQRFQQQHSASTEQAQTQQDQPPSYPFSSLPPTHGSQPASAPDSTASSSNIDASPAASRISSTAASPTPASPPEPTPEPAVSQPAATSPVHEAEPTPAAAPGEPTPQPSPASAPAQPSSEAPPTADAPAAHPSLDAQASPSKHPSAAPPSPTVADEYDPENTPRAAPLRSAKVPSSRLGRLMHYGSLGAGLAWGAAGQYLSGADAKQGSGNPFMGEANLRRLVDKLSTMRGAALKLGQFMSIQDSNMLPPELEEVLLRVQNSANYMPEWQMEKVMREDLGPDWRSHFDNFNPVPFAAASIGQVHAATLASTHPATASGLAPGTKVAVKIQFPGIKQSIASDLGYLTTLLTASAFLPKGLFLDSTIATMRGELEDECDYAREAEMGRRFGKLLEAHRGSKIEGVMEFAVPTVVDELCTGRVLTTEMMRGRPLTQAARYSQERRNQIATSILRLCLQELFQFRLMQTDPNWSNFLLNERTSTLELLDFGATREYSREFIDRWFALLSAAVRGDRAGCLHHSHAIGYLTGTESARMRDAHVTSMLLLAEPFAASSPAVYDFRGQTITARVRAQVPLMLRERKTPPPRETYSLNRKLSGAFLLCAKLGAEVRCREVWEEVAGAYVPASGVLDEPVSSSSASSGRDGARSMHTLSDARRGEPGPRRSRVSTARGSATLLAHPRIRARWAADARAAGLRHASSSAADGVDPALVLGPRRRLDLRSQWSHTSATGAAAALDLPPDALARTQTAAGDGPVLGARPAAETRMKLALGLADAAPAAGEAKAKKTKWERHEERQPGPVRIRGVLVPRKPPPPGPEDCCMSGCFHCTYDLYADAVQDYVAELALAERELAGVREPALSEAEWAEAAALGIRRARARASTGSKAAAEEAAAAAVDAAVRRVEDPTLRAFLEMERRLKDKGARGRPPEEKLKRKTLAEREREQQQQQQQRVLA